MKPAKLVAGLWEQPDSLPVGGGDGIPGVPAPLLEASAFPNVLSVLQALPLTGFRFENVGKKPELTLLWEPETPEQEAAPQVKPTPVAPCISGFGAQLNCTALVCRSVPLHSPLTRISGLVQSGSQRGDVSLC